MKNILIILGIFIFLYVLIVFFIYIFQGKLLYHPGDNNYLDDASLNHQIKKVYIPSDKKLVAWYFKKIQNIKLYFFFMEMQAKLIVEFIN